MEKPTIFFSHSSKDRDLILPIKNKLSDITSNVIKIFMSSDGQSIPFGNNWIHKIEEGLQNSKVMFVFITPNSINNAWVYFESGYAYSKGVEVIPVGIGINIGDLKPPLNLLQGFNVTSGDSLNNFVSILNQKFELNFKENFLEIDYEQIKAIELQSEYDISAIFTSATYEVYSQYSNSETHEIIRYDLEKAMKEYKTFLSNEKIKFSSNNDELDDETILVDGIKFSRTGKEEEPREYNNKLIPNQNHKLLTSISTYNFTLSFELLKKMTTISCLTDFRYLRFNLTNNYNVIHSDIELSSILGRHPDVFSPIDTSIGAFNYKDSLTFSIYDKNRYDTSKSTEYCLGISFAESINPSTEIIELIAKLVDLKIIYPK